jgi:hypothetical protein
LRVFAGKAFLLPRSHSRSVFSSRRILAIFGQSSLDKVRFINHGGLSIMSSARALATLAPVRALATLASVAAVGCCLFAFSWVGLALLGF